MMAALRCVRRVVQTRTDRTNLDALARARVEHLDRDLEHTYDKFIEKLTKFCSVVPYVNNC